jgi:hypothetical protein
VATELEAGDIKKGLWAKAIVETSSTNDAEVRKTYIKLRVRAIKAQESLFNNFLEEAMESLSETEEESAASATAPRLRLERGEWIKAQQQAQVEGKEQQQAQVEGKEQQQAQVEGKEQVLASMRLVPGGNLAVEEYEAGYTNQPLFDAAVRDCDPNDSVAVIEKYLTLRAEYLQKYGKQW